MEAKLEAERAAAEASQIQLKLLEEMMRGRLLKQEIFGTADLLSLHPDQLPLNYTYQWPNKL